jgi:hypothetical protein
LGVTLILVSLYAYAGSFLLELLHRRQNETASATVTEHPQAPGESGSVTLSLPSAASPLPGIQARWKLEFRFHDRELILERPAGKGGRERWPLVAKQRGLYEASGPTVQFSDRFGFARTEVSYPNRLELLVPPKPRGAPGRRPKSVGSGAESRRGRSLRRNELLIESRPYHPGDDLRRLNWKALARTDELLVRIGEEIPPARKWIALICDPGHCSDQVATQTVLRLEDLESQGYRCRLVNGATGEEVTAKEADRFLASLWDSFESPAAEVELSSYSAAVLITPRGATARRETGIIAALGRGTLRLQEVECPARGREERTVLQRLLFVPKERT